MTVCFRSLVNEGIYSGPKRIHFCCDGIDLGVFRICIIRAGLGGNILSIEKLTIVPASFDEGIV